MKALQGSRDRVNGRARTLKRTPVAVTVMPAPDDMPEEQAVIWNQLAPQACSERTLYGGTAMAFRQLCSRLVLLQKMEAQIAADGLMVTTVSLQMDESGGGLQTVQAKAHDLLTKCMTMMQRVDQGMLRFRLSPIGKEMAPVEEAPVDPFAEFDGTAVQ